MSPIPSLPLSVSYIGLRRRSGLLPSRVCYGAEEKTLNSAVEFLEVSERGAVGSCVVFLSVCRSLVTALQVDELVADELLESLEVLAVELDVIVPGALHPQRLHGPLAALVQGQAMGEVDHLILRAVDHQYR